MILHSSEEKERERGTEEEGWGGVLKWRQTAFEFPAVEHTNALSHTQVKTVYIMNKSVCALTFIII